MSATALDRAAARPIPLVPRLIFASRWLQLPLYVGLILAQAVYVYHFWVELINLIEAAFGDANALNMLIAQTVIHLTFLLSAMAVASTDRLMIGAGRAAREH